jgi:hypothetical protein
VDPSSGEVEEDGYNDEYTLEELEVTAADYVKPQAVPNFRKAWWAYAWFLWVGSTAWSNRGGGRGVDWMQQCVSHGGMKREASDGGGGIQLGFMCLISNAAARLAKRAARMGIAKTRVRMPQGRIGPVHGAHR